MKEKNYTCMVHVSYTDSARGNCIDEFIVKTKAINYAEVCQKINEYVFKQYGNSYTGKAINELSEFPVINI